MARRKRSCSIWFSDGSSTDRGERATGPSAGASDVLDAASSQRGLRSGTVEVSVRKDKTSIVGDIAISGCANTRIVRRTYSGSWRHGYDASEQSMACSCDCLTRPWARVKEILLANNVPDVRQSPMLRPRERKRPDRMDRGVLFCGEVQRGSLTMTYFRTKRIALSSALERFTDLFGMGRGGSTPLWSSDIGGCGGQRAAGG